MSEYGKEDMEKLKMLDKALKNLEGVKVPYNLICQYFSPLQKWLNKIIRGNEKNYGKM